MAAYGLARDLVVALDTRLSKRISDLEERLERIAVNLDEDITMVRERVERINRIIGFKYTRRNTSKEPTFSNYLKYINSEYAGELNRFRSFVKHRYPNASNKNIRQKAYNLLKKTQNQWRNNPEALTTVINETKGYIRKGYIQNNNTKKRRNNTNRNSNTNK